MTTTREHFERQARICAGDGHEPHTRSESSLNLRAAFMGPIAVAWACRCGLVRWTPSKVSKQRAVKLGQRLVYHGQGECTHIPCPGHSVAAWMMLHYSQFTRQEQSIILLDKPEDLARVSWTPGVRHA